MKLLTTTTAAKELGVTADRVRALITAKRLRATLLGSQYVIQPADLDAVRVRKPGRPRNKEVRHAK